LGGYGYLPRVSGAWYRDDFKFMAQQGFKVAYRWFLGRGLGFELAQGRSYICI
jgi:hypothetical protein